MRKPYEPIKTYATYIGARRCLTNGKTYHIIDVWYDKEYHQWVGNLYDDRHNIVKTPLNEFEGV